MSTLGSYGKPPANDLIKPLTFIKRDASRESSGFTVTFCSVSFYKYVFGSQIWVQLRGKHVLRNY